MIEILDLGNVRDTSNFCEIADDNFDFMTEKEWPKLR